MKLTFITQCQIDALLDGHVSSKRISTWSPELRSILSWIHVLQYKVSTWSHELWISHPKVKDRQRNETLSRIVSEAKLAPASPTSQHLVPPTSGDHVIKALVNLSSSHVVARLISRLLQILVLTMR